MEEEGASGRWNRGKTGRQSLGVGRKTLRVGQARQGTGCMLSLPSSPFAVWSTTSILAARARVAVTEASENPIDDFILFKLAFHQ